jgi:hypothetical protein
MATVIKRRVFDFFVKDYATTSSLLGILPDNLKALNLQAQPHYKGNFIQRWQLSLQGETSPIVSRTTVSQKNATGQAIYRYDWAFGMTLIKGFYWDWMEEICSVAVHVVLEPIDEAPAAVPISATLSALHPSRNTKGKLEIALPKIPQVAAKVAKIGGHVFHFLNDVSSGLMLASNVLESVTGNEKNWFLYQFLDEGLKSPTVEWRINKTVLTEYGPLLRGTLFLAFFGSSQTTPGAVRLLLRPQVRYCQHDDISFTIPTDALGKDHQVFIEVKPQDRKEPPARSLPTS